MSTAVNLSHVVTGSAFIIAFIVGAVSQRTNFCTLGAVSDIVNMDDWGRMRMWVLAIAIAIIGAQGLYAAGLIDLSKSFYVRPDLTLLSYVVGGALFGVGMTLASGCGSRTLVRIGGGNLKSLVVFVFLGISAYMTMKGLFGVWRIATLDVVGVDLAARGIPTQDLPTLLAGWFGIERKALAPIVAGVVALGLLIFVFKDREFRTNRDGLLAGAVWGLGIVAGWYVTGHLGFGENPDTLEDIYFATNSRTIESMTFVAPYGYTLELLMLWSDKSLGLTFGIATVLGLVAGSLAYSLAFKKFRVETFTTADDLRNHILGAVLMGFGGVTAMGCTIGQGISGFSTLAVGSLLAFAAMVAGCAATLKYQYWKLMNS